MSEESQPKTPRKIIPVISFRLPDLITKEFFLKDVPTYISTCISDGVFVSIDGQWNGQPFHTTFPTGRMALGPDNQPLYMRLDLPQHSIRYYERRDGEGGPNYAVNYTNQPPEERDEQRRRTLALELHAHDIKGKFVLDTDSEMDMEHLKKLQAITDSLVDTMNVYLKLGGVNTKKLRNSHGAGTLESLVVPQTE